MCSNRLWNFTIFIILESKLRKGKISAPPQKKKDIFFSFFSQVESVGEGVDEFKVGDKVHNTRKHFFTKIRRLGRPLSISIVNIFSLYSLLHNNKKSSQCYKKK